MKKSNDCLHPGILILSVIFFFSCPANAQQVLYVFKGENGKYGFRTPEKKVTIPPKYDDAYDFRENLATVNLGNKWGYINKAGKEIIPIKYQEALDFNEGMGIVKLNEKWGFVDQSGKEIAIRYSGVAADGFNEGLAGVRLGEKWGYINKVGKEITPIKYSGIHIFNEGISAVRMDNKWGFIDKTGKEITPIKYDGIRSYQNGMSAVRLNGKWGFINKSGKEVTPIIYENAWDFNEAIAAVELNNKYGYIDKTGKEIIPVKLESFNHFNEGLAPVKLNNKWGFIDNTGKEVIPIKYDAIRLFNEGLAAVFINGKCGFIDKTGKLVINPLYDGTFDFHDGTAKVIKDGEYATIDHPQKTMVLNDVLKAFKSNDGRFGFKKKSGAIAIPAKYENAFDFTEGLGQVRLNDKWGFVDKTGKEVLPIKYTSVFGFSEGLAAVVGSDYKYGFISKNGERVIEFKYDEAWPFSEERAAVALKGKWGFIDNTGKEITTLKYHDVGNLFTKEYYNGYSGVELNDKWGLVDWWGKEIVPPRYQEVDNLIGFNDGLMAVKQNNKWGFIDKYGNEVIPPQYDSSSYFENGKAKVKKDGKEFYIDKPATNTTSQQKNNIDKEADNNTRTVTPKTPPIAMKGTVDASMVGTWQYHDPSNFNTSYILRPDGTYDLWSDMITSQAPPPNYKNFWRVDGDVIELLPEGGKEVFRLKLFKRNDPQNNKPALVIQWQAGTDYYRNYYPTEPKNLWPVSNSNTTIKEAPNIMPVKLSEPPVRLHGTVDLSIIGLWKTTSNNMDYYMDLKADGTQETWPSTNPKKSKGYWRIDNSYFEVVFEGNNKVDRFKFAKVNDLVRSKPTIMLVSSSYYPVTDREMWR